jgi:hypothetical protein
VICTEEARRGTVAKSTDSEQPHTLRCEGTELWRVEILNKMFTNGDAARKNKEQQQETRSGRRW